jgi:hypothetical protein
VADHAETRVVLEREDGLRVVENDGTVVVRFPRGSWFATRRISAAEVVLIVTREQKPRKPRRR